MAIALVIMPTDTRWGREQHSRAAIKKAAAHLCRRDKALAGLIRKIGPCRWKVHRDHWRVLVESIISQQLSDKAATAISRKIVALFPRRRYPTAADFVLIKPQKIRGAGLSRAKIGFIKDLAKRVASGQLNLKRISRLDDEAVIGELTKVKGIGRWTAEMFLMFSVGRMDVLPVGDLGIRRGFKKLYGFKVLPAPRTMERIARAWQPYRSAACWYLWHL